MFAVVLHLDIVPANTLTVLIVWVTIIQQQLPLDNCSWLLIYLPPQSPSPLGCSWLLNNRFISVGQLLNGEARDCNEIGINSTFQCNKPKSK